MSNTSHSVDTTHLSRAVERNKVGAEVSPSAHEEFVRLAHSASKALRAAGIGPESTEFVPLEKVPTTQPSTSGMTPDQRAAFNKLFSRFVEIPPLKQHY